MCKLGLQQVYNKLQLDFSLSFFSAARDVCRLTSPSIRGCRSNSWQEEERRGGRGGAGGEGGQVGGGGGGVGGGGRKREDREQQWGCHPNQQQCVAWRPLAKSPPSLSQIAPEHP